MEEERGGTEEERGGTEEERGGTEKEGRGRGSEAVAAEAAVAAMAGEKGVAAVFVGFPRAR